MTTLKVLKTPIFKAEGIPDLERHSLRLKFTGLKKNIVLMFDDIMKLPQTTLNCRMTSVSGFSVRANWQGVLWRDMMAHVGDAKDYNFIIFESPGGYTTNCYKEDLLPDRWIFCHSVDGEPLELEYGGPLRMIIPNLWGYKSCKWLTGVRFSAENEPGYWETRGYTDRGLIEPGTTLDVNTHTERPIRGGEVTEF